MALQAPPEQMPAGNVPLSPSFLANRVGLVDRDATPAAEANRHLGLHRSSRFPWRHLQKADAVPK